MTRDILHVDLDAFYASVERKRRPELTGRPLIVGGDGRRGVVLSCSYEARAFGVRNGIPSARAKRLCKDAVFVPPDFSQYTAASKIFRTLLKSFTPRVETISLDEAFCDVSGAHRLYGTNHEIAARIRTRVHDEMGLVCSVGGGPTKLVAKVASRACKPDGMLIVGDPIAFLHPLPIEDLWGVGQKTADVLRSLGAQTIGDVARLPHAVLKSAFGPAGAAHLQSVSWGRDPSPVVSSRGENKSIGAESTFPYDLDDEDAIGAELLRLADRVSSRMVRASVHARTITVKIRVADFTTFTRSRTLKIPTDDVWTVFATAREAYTAFRRGRRTLRLLGISASNLEAGEVSAQLSLDRAPAYTEAEHALSAVRERFGSDAVRLARLVERKPKA